MKLVIIEGVGKEATIKKYLGNEYEVIATKGHVRDLPQKTIGVNVKNNFEWDFTIAPHLKMAQLLTLSQRLFCNNV